GGPGVGPGCGPAMSGWTLGAGNGTTGVDQKSIERVDPGGCPCSAISSTPGPYTPLDVDQNRIVVSGTNETRVLTSDGAVLLSEPVPTAAAQLSGSELVIAAGTHLQVYDTRTGGLVAMWPMPASPVGHDCDFYGDPSCNYGSPQSHVMLEDLAHGLAAYIYAGQVHLLRLSDGADRTVAYGTLARFTSDGLIDADGARISLTPYDR